MAWGIGNSKSTSNTDAQQVGSQTGTGPGTSLYVEGYKSNQNINVYQTMTDHGALERAGGLMEESINAMSNASIEAFNSAERSASEAYVSTQQMVSDALAAGESIANTSQQEASQFASDALLTVDSGLQTASQMAQYVIDSNEATTRNVLDATYDLGSQAFGMTQNILDGAADFVRSATADAAYIAERGFETAEYGLSTASGMARDAFDNASQLGGRAIDASEYIATRAIESNEVALADAMRFGQYVTDSAAGQVARAMQESSIQQERAMMAAEQSMNASRATMGEAIESNTLISRDAMDLSRSVVDLTGNINQQNVDFMRGTLTDVTEMSAWMNEQNVSFFGETLDGVTDTVQMLDASRSRESTANLEKISELATVVQTGGESINANVNKMIAGLAIVTAGVIGWAALA